MYTTDVVVDGCGVLRQKFRAYFNFNLFYLYYWYSYKWMHVCVCPSLCSFSATRCGFQQSFMFGCLQSKFGCLQSKLMSTLCFASFQSGIILTVQETKKDFVNFTRSDSSYRHSWFCSDLHHLFATLFHISLEAFMEHFSTNYSHLGCDTVQDHKLCWYRRFRGSAASLFMVTELGSGKHN